EQCYAKGAKCRGSIVRRKPKRPVLREKTCVRCRERYLGLGRGWYCPSCREERIAEAKRLYKWKRRQREKFNRRKQAGMIPLTISFSRCEAPCAHCGEVFTPQRSTARYCGARCRVAANRAKK